MKEILKNIPWLPVTLILLLGVGCSIWIQCVKQKPPTETPKETEPAQQVLHTLTFLDTQEQTIAELQCEDSGFVMPPEQSSEADGLVFRGWNQKLFNIRSSTELRPLYQDLTMEKNAFYMDSLYAKPGDAVERDLWLAGNVSLSSCTLTMVYDATALIDFTCDVSKSPFRILSQEPGTLVLELNSPNVLTEAQSMAKIRFTIDPGRTDLAKTTIQLSVTDPKVQMANAIKGTDSVAAYCDIYTLN